jgi:hypothetical protein
MTVTGASSFDKPCKIGPLAEMHGAPPVARAMWTALLGLLFASAGCGEEHGYVYAAASGGCGNVEFDAAPATMYRLVQAGPTCRNQRRNGGCSHRASCATGRTPTHHGRASSDTHVHR